MLRLIVKHGLWGNIYNKMEATKIGVREYGVFVYLLGLKKLKLQVHVCTQDSVCSTSVGRKPLKRFSSTSMDIHLKPSNADCKTIL